MSDVTPPHAPDSPEAQPVFIEQVAEMRRHLETVRDLDGLDRFKGTLEMPAAFFEHFNAALACYDRLIDFVLEFTGTGQRVYCKKGCCNCCIDLVRGVSTAETVNIYHHVRSWPDARQVFEYHRDSAETFMEILQSKLKPGEFAFPGDDPRVKECHVAYNARLRPCGFLDQQTGCCRIYPVRPIACRYFFSLDPPEMCTPTHPNYLSRNTRMVYLPPEIHELITAIGRRLGFRPLNYLAGAFCGLAAETMHARPIKVIPSAAPGGSRPSGPEPAGAG